MNKPTPVKTSWLQTVDKNAPERMPDYMTLLPFCDTFFSVVACPDEDNGGEPCVLIHVMDPLHLDINGDCVYIKLDVEGQKFRRVLKYDDFDTSMDFDTDLSSVWEYLRQLPRTFQSFTADNLLPWEEFDAGSSE